MCNLNVNDLITSMTNYNIIMLICMVSFINLYFFSNKCEIYPSDYKDVVL